MELPAMFTHVPDASAPTRLSALSDVPAIKYAADFQQRFLFAPVWTGGQCVRGAMPVVSAPRRSIRSVFLLQYDILTIYF